MIYSFLEDKKSYIRGDFIVKKEGGKKSITIQRYKLVEHKLKNYFIPFIVSSTISTNFTPKSFDKWDKWRMQI